MTRYEQSIADTYRRHDLKETILSALEAAGKDIDHVTRDDLAAFDEFHIKGRDATRELATLAELSDDSRVLDVGSCIGGPARTLATEFGCSVTGLDLVEEYCDVATVLTEAIDLDDQVGFQHGNALDLPFGDEAFDVVWLQHVTMNIENKRQLFDEVHRVLRPLGKLVLHEIVAGASGDVTFPVPWADEPAHSFLIEGEKLARLLDAADFHEVLWRDTSEESLKWFRGRLSAMNPRATDSPPLGLHLLMGGATAEKTNNVVRNLEDERIGVVQAIMIKRIR